MNLEIMRFCYSILGTFGVIRGDGLLLYTAERPWVNNEINISCIPCGNYPLIPTRYNKGGYDTVRIDNVPDRSNILIHRANTAADVEGCIGVGLRLGYVNSTWGVTDSGAAFHQFMNWYEVHKSKRIAINHTGMPVHEFP